jgi:hypothetical protein
MRKLAFAFLLLTCSVPLRADECLQNGDFTDGITHWHGDGRAPADFASDNPLQASDPFTAQGIIIVLKHTAWTKIAQDFKINAANAVLTITYQLSPELTFSDKPEDYTGVPAQLGWGWKPFNGPAGDWMIDVTAEDGIHGTHNFVKAVLGTGKPQTYRAQFKGLAPGDGQTLTLAFPPGDGTVVILNVSVTGQ